MSDMVNVYSAAVLEDNNASDLIEKNADQAPDLVGLFSAEDNKSSKVELENALELQFEKEADGLLLDDARAEARAIRYGIPSLNHRRLTKLEERLYLRRVIDGRDTIKTKAKNVPDIITLDSDAQDAATFLRVHNQRLVAYFIIKKSAKYQNKGVDFKDLFGEGELGLVRAIERFGLKKGTENNRFSSFAGWWIEQKLQLAIKDHSQTIRVPVHFRTLENQISFQEKEFQQEYSRGATEVELAEYCQEKGLKIKISDIRKCNGGKGLKFIGDLDGRDGYDDGEGLRFSDRLPDPNNFQNPVVEFTRTQKKELVEQLLSHPHLTLKERDVICLRKGIGLSREYTLKEVGKMYNVSDERIRQIEKRAMGKLKALARWQVTDRENFSMDLEF